ncbi:MAG: GYD domain-containing protein [Anaerolineae bacterium]|nr:GYD domain-containing protein [Anaerolineae bacterium]
MTTYVLLSKVSMRNSGEVRSLSERMRGFKRKLAERYPEVKGLSSYALLGSYDFLHIFEAPDANTATKVALLAQAFGAGTTETLTAIPFDEFSAIVDEV